MPRLQNRRHEGLAQCRARDHRVEEAFEQAGYPPHRGKASRLISRPDVAMRVNELRRHFIEVPAARHPEAMEAVVTLARRAMAAGAPRLRGPEGDV
jgi:alpha-beta hydrolase superfamily lysophospholipase